VSPDSGHSGLDSNQAPQEYESAVLTLRQPVRVGCEDAGLHGVTSKEIELIIIRAAGTSAPTQFSTHTKHKDETVRTV
jgi:hypothetical protein